MAILPTRQQGLLPQMSNPLTLMGLAMLSQGYSATPQGPLQGIGSGLMQGMAAANQFQAAQRQAEIDQERLNIARQEMAMREAEAQREQAALESRQATVEELIAGNPELAAAIRANPDRASALILEAQLETQDPTTLARNLEAAGLERGTPEFQNAMMQAIMKPETQITNIPNPPAGYTWANPADPSEGAIPIPGGPADVAAKSGQAEAQAQSGKTGSAMATYTAQVPALLTAEQQVNQAAQDVLNNPGDTAARTRYDAAVSNYAKAAGALDAPTEAVTEGGIAAVENTFPTATELLRDVSAGRFTKGMIGGGNPIPSLLEANRNKYRAQGAGIGFDVPEWTGDGQGLPPLPPGFELE